MMKTTNTAILSGIVFGILSGCTSHLVRESAEAEVSVLNPVFNEMSEILDCPIESYNEAFDSNETAIVLRVERVSEVYLIRSSIMYKIDFRWYLRDKSDALIGYFKVGNHDVIAFGYYHAEVLLRNGYIRRPDYLSVAPLEDDKDMPPPPPPLFEPIVCSFEYSNDRVVFKGRGAIQLLE